MVGSGQSAVFSRLWKLSVCGQYLAMFAFSNFSVDFFHNCIYISASKEKIKKGAHFLIFFALMIRCKSSSSDVQKI
jgi:hypothetical protein